MPTTKQADIIWLDEGLGVYFVRARTVYKQSFQTPGQPEHLEALRQITADMIATDIAPDLISRLLISALNQAQKEISDE